MNFKTGNSREHTGKPAKTLGALETLFSSVPGCSRHAGPQKDRKEASCGPLPPAETGLGPRRVFARRRSSDASTAALRGGLDRPWHSQEIAAIGSPRATAGHVRCAGD
jgi:hypothetical protein